ncbi:MAG: EI24 domain-containing protein [Sphingomonadaceae bacterium]|nr:EI24 domain-containing protein [Sphingomonadaceae bacterium]
MLGALTRSVGDLADPRIVAILVRSLAVTLVIFAVLGVVLAWLLHGADLCAWLDSEPCPLGLTTSGAGAFVVAALGLWLLFPAVALGVISAYVDRIVEAIEASHYPLSLVDARPLGLLRGSLLGLRSMLRVIVYNLIALPFYLLLLITGVGTVVLFVLVNALAFGRDLGEIVSSRHSEGREWLRATLVERALIGSVVAAIFLVPFANLLAPVLGAAMMTHLFHTQSSGRAMP